jgi:uroporphyrinogen decarboxylase
MRGLEKFLCDYVANPEWVAALQERLLAYNLMLTRVFAAADVDMIQYWGDVAMQNGMMVSPKSWQRLDKQFWKQLIQGTREVNPDIKFFFHSDGDTRAIIPDLIEVGFDIINPLQPECMNPALIKQTYGKQVTLDGGGSVQRTLPYGTIDDVKREVEFLLRHCAYDGGYIFSASNTVSFDSPTENIVAFYETARDFDLSQLEGPPTEIPEPPCRSIGIKN